MWRRVASLEDHGGGVTKGEGPTNVMVERYVRVTRVTTGHVR